MTVPAFIALNCFLHIAKHFEQEFPIGQLPDQSQNII